MHHSNDDTYNGGSKKDMKLIWIFMVAYLANTNEIKLIWIFVVTYLANMNEIWGVGNGKRIIKHRSLVIAI
jgi:hypothetical protein